MTVHGGIAEGFAISVLLIANSLGTVVCKISFKCGDCRLVMYKNIADHGSEDKSTLDINKPRLEHQMTSG